MAAPRQRAYCSVYGCLNSSKIKPTLLSFFKLPTDAERHSVDSVASYSSQNHVDRIRTQNFSAASCQDEDFSSIKTSFFRRSLSNLECSNKRPESVTSNTSTTKSHYRELVERKSSQDEHKSVTNAVGDIQYFEIPTENLEFDKPRNSLEKKQEERLKKRKLSKSTVKDKEKELCENKAKKHEKYQSKLADYYKLPAQLPQDEFYQHLTRSKAAEDLLQKRSPNLDTKFNGSYGRLWKHKEPEGSNLRRSRSLAVIREETFTDLHIQNHVKNKRSQLIPRARLFDKPCFKDRLIGHAKYQTKEEVLQSIYIESTASCFGEINAQRDNDKTIVHTENKSLKEDAASRESSHYTKSVSGSWPNLNEKNKQTHLHKDSNGHSCNPSDIDSLDSNYVRKHYNFEAHCKSFRSSSPDTERSFISMNQSKDLYGTTDDHETDNEDQSRSINNTAKYFTNDSLSMTHSDITKSELAESENITDDEVSIQSKHSERKENIQEETITKNCEVGDGEENQSVVSGNDGTVSSPPDSITSYISISIASSAGKSHKLEYLAHSLAEKIDAYCDSQFKEKVSVAPNTLGFENNHPDGNSIYTKVNKKKIFADIRRDSFLNKKGNENIYNEIKKNSNKKVYVSNTYIESDTYSVKSHCTPNRNITTEPFETTLIENQYYSLPDINIGKCLRKSERIDAQLREEDPENVPCENNYKIAQTHFRHILSNKRSENYGQLNKTTNNNFQVNSNPSVIEEAKIVESFTKIEDDLKSIVTIDTSNPDDKDPHFYCSDTLQNERELNEIEGTIRNNKLITKSENLKITNTVYKPEIYTIKSLSNDNINKCMQEKKACFGIRKHYSLRQRDPTDDEIQRLPSPKTIQRNLSKPLDTVIKIPQIKEVKTPLLSRVQSFKTAADSSIAIVPLSGHQTIVIDPPLTQKTKEIKASAVAFTAQETRPAINQLLNTKVELSKKKSEPVFEKKKETKENKITIFPIDTSSYYTPKEPFITIKLNKVVKTTIPKLKSCEKFTYTQNKFERPPPKLIIEDNKSNSPAPTINKSDTSMTRPQVLQVMDSQNKKQTTLVNMDKNKEINTNGLTDNTKLEPNPETKQDIKEPKNEMSVREKLNNVIKTDKQYQEKINSVKSYWSRLVDKAPETQQPTKILETKIKHEEENTNDQSELEKEVKKEIQAEEEKSSPDISVGSIIKSLEGVTIVDSIRKISLTKLQLWKDETEKVKSDSEMKETTLKKKNKQSDGNFYEKLKPKKINFDMCRDSPEIEIVELSSNDNHSQKTQATLIKAKGYENGNDDFDHVRYKVMKSELFKNSMIANYRKEAQFDGLLQYLQDYSFQELLVNNNIVIIEPVRTKIEPPRRNITVTSKIPQTPLKKADINCGQINRSKNAIRRHFFYHPIRVNKEIIEEELPNPDTVKKVRNLFEDTLKMKTFMTQDHLLIDDLGLTRRASSYRNLNGDSKGKKIEGRRNVIRHLTIDTNFGNKKWDNASLSSGISSGDFGSNNEYDNEGLSPYSKNVMDVYSSSDEYLCDPMSQDFCCESQYVSPDILKKIRERGTSITYYGGKVLNSIPGSNVSPMTNTIMEEIKSLKKNCNRDCYSCQTKCRGDKCSCLIENKHKQYRIVSDIQKATATGDMSNQDKNKYTDGFPGFKFKLVKSNSCSSRLELTGTHESKSGRLKYKKSPKTDDLPLLYDDENSVKNKICKLESYNEGILKTPFKSKDGAKINALSKNVIEMYETSGIKCKNELSQRNASLSETEIKLQNQAKNIAQTDNSTNDANTFEKKFYYLNENLDQGKVTTGKFGDMVFEEFEVLESCYDSLNSNYSLK